LIRLELSGTSTHRDIALRVISAACKLVNAKENDPDTEEFRMPVVSALGEAFNSIALPRYRRSPEGIIKIEIEVALGWMRIHLSDFGTRYDPTAIPFPTWTPCPNRRDVWRRLAATRLVSRKPRNEDDFLDRERE
jgi:hypothetical protein